ncbi:MAG: hypothetical protein LBT06_20885 [Hungatella sp.]|jgi:hypothetical protein|nr:hypothetical protein [Hungatella sp.]
MGWLIEMLLEAVREQCSQFIIDMMEIVNQVFTELLSCDLDLFEELFSVVKDLYREAIVPLAIAILLLIFIWQLLKGMFGKYLNSEDPMELVIRSCVCLFMVTGAKGIVNYVLEVAGTPYDWVTGTHITVVSFADFTSVAEAVTSGLGIDSLNIQLLMVIIQFMVAWNYLKLLFIMAERYVLLGVFSYTAPLAFATGGSKATNNILASWSKMFGGQVVLIILDAWCLKVYLSGYGNMMASGYGFTKFFAATLCLVGFGKIAFKLDSYMASLGVNLGRTSPGMGGLGVMMMLGRVFSHFGSPVGGNGSPAGGKGGGGMATGAAKMASGFGSPIPMGGPANGSQGKASWGDTSAAMAGGDTDLSVPSSRRGQEGEPDKSHGMAEESRSNNAFGADMNVPSYQDGSAPMNGDPAENLGVGVQSADEYPEGPFGSDESYNPAETGGLVSDYDGMEIGAAGEMGTMEAGGEAFDQGTAAAALDSGYQGAQISGETGDYEQSSSSGPVMDQEIGISQAGDAPFVSEQESGVAAGQSDIAMGADGGMAVQTGLSGPAETGMSVTGGSREVGDASGGGTMPGGIQESRTMPGSGQETGTISEGGQAVPGQNMAGALAPDNQQYQTFERNGVKYARFAADTYEKPVAPHRIVEADGRKFYEMKMEPVQSGIKATLQKDGKIHYEKTYKEVLPAAPKIKPKTPVKKENPVKDSRQKENLVLRKTEGGDRDRR